VFLPFHFCIHLPWPDEFSQLHQKKKPTSVVQIGRPKKMGREVSESCVDSLLTEMVSSYCNRFYANKPELAARRIEAIGYQVGHQLSERYTMERPRFNDHLEAIKFICKDFWSELFKKQIDNLKTNHRGTFVLQDNRFRWLDPAALAEDKTAQAMSMYLYFPCGIIRGALSNLGIPCAVSADISALPACEYIPNHDCFCR
ncbi:Trafficking protein particle complex subunit 6B, partial [Linum perenne]